jgi:DNA-binding transcriptional LysR family regulator
MEFTQLKSFVAVAEHGHLTRAAETLHLSQPALSGQIKALEENLGVLLFERQPSGMMLTASGKDLLSHARGILAAVQQLRHAASSLHLEPTGRLRIGTVLDASFLRVGDLLARAFERYPQIELDLHQVVSNEALTGIRSKDLDASFYFGSMPDDLAGVRLRQVLYKVVVPSAWANELEGASLEALAARPWILTPEHSSHRQLIVGLFDGEENLPARIVEADNESVINDLVESGVGVSLVRQEIASASSSAGRSVIWPGAEASTDLWLAYAVDRASDPLIEAVLSVVHDVWADSPQLEEQLSAVD